MTAAIFEADIARLQSAQNSTASENLVACVKAEASHDLFNASISELQQRCGGRHWTNANEGTLSVYVTNPFIAKALGDIARAKGMAQVARDAGLSRESLYKALSGERSPGFDTVLKVIRALGLRLYAKPSQG